MRGREKSLVGLATTKSGNTDPATVVDGFQTSHSLQLGVRTEMWDEADSGSFHLSVHASAPASARASGPGSSRMGRWINAANRPSTTAAHHIGV